MDPDARILLLDESRYHTLLIERELARACPEAIVAIFHSARAAIDELLRAHYHAAVIDGALSELPSEEVVRSIRRFDRQMPILILADPRKSRASDEEGLIYLKKDEQYFSAVPQEVTSLLSKSRLTSEIAPLASLNAHDDGAGAARSIVGMLSHEINNPLMIIEGVAELLAERKDTDPRIQKKIELIRRAARRIGQVMGQLQRGSDLPTLPHSNTELSGAPYLTHTKRRRIGASSFHNSD